MINRDKYGVSKRALNSFQSGHGETGELKDCQILAKE